MAKKFAQIPSAIWDDPDWLRLTAGAQQLYLLLDSQCDISLCGVVVLRAKLWAGFAADTTVESVESRLHELERAEFVLVDPDADEVWLRRAMAHEKVLRSSLTAKGIARAYLAVRSALIRRRIVATLPDGLAERFPEGFIEMQPKALQALLEAPFSEPLQLGLGLTDTPSEAPSEGASQGPSEAPYEGSGAPHISNLKSQNSELNPQTPPESPVDDGGPDLTVVGEDPIITRAIEHLAQQDVEMAVLRAVNGKGEPINSPARLKRFRVGENRAAFLAEAKRLMETFVITEPNVLAEILTGSRSKQYLERRHA